MRPFGVRSGAEIEGLVKSATSFALNRQVDVTDLTKPIDEDSIKVHKQHFFYSCAWGPSWHGLAGLGAAKCIVALPIL